MGSSLQRLEVLLVGLVIICSGVAVAVLLVLRPATPAAYIQTTPQPISGSEHGSSAPEVQPTSALVAAPTDPTAAIAASEPTSIPATAPASVAAVAFAVSSRLTVAWPWLLLTVGGAGLALAATRLRTRRLAYTNQNVKQFFAASDPITHASNMRIVRQLAERGLLTPELAAATGVDHNPPRQRRIRRLWLPRLPHLTVPRITLPKIKLRSIRMPGLRWPVTLAAARPGSASTMLPEQLHAAPFIADVPAIIASAEPVVGVESPPVMMPAAAPVRDLGVTRERLPDYPDCAAAPGDLLATQGNDIVETEPPAAFSVDVTADDWTSEDRALAVAGVMAELWAAHTLQSPILAIDTASAAGSGQVVVTIDAHADEEDWLAILPERMVERRPTWRASWQRGRLEVVVATDGARPPAGGPLIAPILAHGRGYRTLRFFSLASQRHLGLYGGGALATLHAMLGSILFTQPPANIGLAILDAGEITPLYRGVAHLVVPPGPAYETLELLAQAIRRSAHGNVRPLLLVVVEPDDTLLTMLLGIVARLQARPSTPVHLIIVQEQLRSAGRELYRLLPAVLTSGGSGAIALLPGQGAWPKRGEARLVGRGMRLDGREIRLDEAMVAAQLSQLRGQPDKLPPVLWDDTASSAGDPPASSALDTAAAAPSAVEESRDSIELTSRPEVAQATDAGDDTAQQRRIASAMTARRQALMDAEAAPVAAVPPTTAVLCGTSQDQIDSPPTKAAGVAALGATPRSAGAPESVIDSAPLVVDGSQDTAHAPPRSQRAALLHATLSAGAADPALSLDAPPLHDSYPAATPPPAAHVSPAATAPAPMVEPDNGFPVGPAPLGRVAMADLMARIVAAPAIVAGQANELGVTKNRIADLLKGAYTAQARDLAEILMAWFDLAGLLAEPTRAGRLRHPRALITTNLIEIAARLGATPCPDKATAQAMWAESAAGNT
jgi:hypothetical protein